jgi:hypothetical protein
MACRGAGTVLMVLLALAVGAWAPSTARAVTTFGSSLPAPSAGYYDSCTDACTAAQVDLPGAQTRSPVDGTIVRFRLRTGAGSDAQQVRFRVLRRSDGVSFVGAGTSAAFALPTSAGVTEFPVSMPVRAGDYIGIDQPGGSKRAVIVAQDADAFQAGWFPTLADNGQARPSGNPRGSAPTRYDLLLQADVEPTPASSPTPPGPAPQPPRNCTTVGQVATCPDLSQPAMCGPTGLGFPQCSLPFSLPTACSGAGTGLPTCNLPGNYVVACGGLGLNLGVCKLPPLTVPQVCGPTTAGLPPCAAGNHQVLACGPTTVGLPACAFKTLIKAPEPIDVNAGELDLVIGCPSTADGSARGAVAAETPKTCAANIDLADLVSTKRGALQSMASTLAFVAYLGGNADPEFDAYQQQHHDAANHNYVTFNYRARELILHHLKSDLDSGYSGDPFQPLPSSTATSIAELLRSKAPTFPGLNLGSYEDPIDLWQRADAFPRREADGRSDRRRGERALPGPGAREEEEVEGESRAAGCVGRRRLQGVVPQARDRPARQERHASAPAAAARDGPGAACARVAQEPRGRRAAGRQLQGQAAPDRPLRRLPPPGQAEGQAQEVDRVARARRRRARVTRIPSRETASDIFDWPAIRSLKTKGTCSIRLPIRYASWVVSTWKA